jgi:hypothetical protein
MSASSDARHASHHATSANTASPTTKPLNICIASPDFAGADGDEGAALMVMANGLVAAGHNVTCLFLGAKEAHPGAWQQWVEIYRRNGLTLVALPQMNRPELGAPSHLLKSYEAYQWLKKNDRFDIIHFPDELGPGYHTATAKHHGVAFSRATICIGLRGINAWLKSGAPEQLNEPVEVDTQFMERRAVALADALVSPSQNLARWISDGEWAKVTQPAEPSPAAEAAQAIQALSIDPTNIVALKALARLHLNAGLPDAAEEACQWILTLDAADAEALEMIAEAHAINAKVEGAKQSGPAQQARRQSIQGFAAGLDAAFA